MRECEAEHTSIHDEFLTVREPNVESDILKKMQLHITLAIVLLRK